MQLGRNKPIISALSLATATLLGAAKPGLAGRTEIEASAQIYSETNRVKVFSGVVELRKEFKENQSLLLKTAFDALTGASPIGAAPLKKFQSITRPSGLGFFNVDPNKLPMDDTFEDARESFSATYTHPLSRLSTVTLGGLYSNESDYKARAFNLALTRDFNRRNTTLAVSAAYSNDVVTPWGGVPPPLAVVPLPSEVRPREGVRAGKDVFDALIGVTQVVDRNTIARINYAYGRNSGYLNEPYKILSEVRGADWPEPGELVSYVYERRPQIRNRHALYAQIRRYLSGNTVDCSYRFYWDDWGIVSHTAEVFYRWSLPHGHALQPHIRWYYQGKADFYRYTLIKDDPLPSFASADFRLAAFNAVTLGLQYTFPLRAGQKIKLAAEYYTQYGGRSPPVPERSLVNADNLPEIGAVIIRVGYSLDL